MNEEELKKDIEEKKINFVNFNKNLCIDNPEITFELLMKKDKHLVELAQAEARLEGFQKGKLEQKEEDLFKIKRLVVDIEKHWDKVVNQKENVLRGLKQLQKEIVEEKGK